MTVQTPVSVPYPVGGEPLTLHVALGPCRLRLRTGGGTPWIQGSYVDPSDETPIRHRLTGGTLLLDQERNFAGTVRLVRGTPTLDLEVGTDRPVRLRVDSGASEVELNLGGLPLTGLEIRAGAGKVTVRLGSPNPVEADEVVVRMGAGSLDTVGLGHLDARRLQVDAGAAALALDLTGQARGPLEGRITTGMSSVRLAVPSSRPVRVTTEGSAVTSTDVGDGFVTRDGAFHLDGGDGPPIALAASVAVGSLVLRAVAGR